MSIEDTRRFLLRMKFDCDFFYNVAAIEDPDERLAHIRSLGYAISDEEIRSSFGRPLPPPDKCPNGRVRETLWEEKERNFACRAVYVGDSSALLVISGEFDMAAAPRVQHLLGRLAAEGITDHVAFDLTECRFIDSTGLAVLIDALKAAKTPLKVAVGNEEIRKVLGITGLVGLFTLCATHEEAMESLERQFGTQ